MPISIKEFLFIYLNQLTTLFLFQEKFSSDPILSFHFIVSFLVSDIIWSPFCLIVTVLTLQNCVTVLC